MEGFIKKVEQVAKQRFQGNSSCHDWDHVVRVRSLALAIGKKEKANLKTVETAALLHDIMRAEEARKKGKICHALAGAQEAEKILLNLGEEESFIKEVKHCIEAHRYRNSHQPRSIEAKVLSDADKLDALGAIGVGRGFMWCGHHGLNLHNTDPKIISQNNPYDKKHCLYAEYHIKLKFLKDRMFTRTGKKIAKERSAFMADFLKRLDGEVKGKL